MTNRGFQFEDAHSGLVHQAVMVQPVVTWRPWCMEGLQGMLPGLRAVEGTVTCLECKRLQAEWEASNAIPA